MALAVVAAAAGAVNAKEFRFKVKADQETLLGTPTIVDEHCRSGGLWLVKVLTEPSHGTFLVKKTINRLGTQIVGSTKCAGRDVPGLTLSYTPAKGFRGVDHFAFTISSAHQGHDRREVSFYVLVE